jgi:hypothetical protein
MMMMMMVLEDVVFVGRKRIRIQKCARGSSLVTILLVF